jgi:pimeloyl-ACP methyl ester carboxylesterase
MAQRIPGAVLEVIPARSHWTHLEAVEEFLSAVDRFARRL